MKILIVDDDKEIRDSLGDFFTDEGWRVVTDGAEALEVLRSSDPPHVVVLDLLMPVLDGAAVYRHIRSEPRLARVPVIVSTSDASRAPPGSTVLKKPIDLVRLRNLVAHHAPSLENSDPPRPAPAYRALIFLVDDEDNLRASTEELLEDHDYLVLSARNGVEALARMRGVHQCAVAVVDLVMPMMDGWDLIAAMKRDGELAHIPILVLTGKGRGPIEGADAVIEKPYDADRFLAAVDRLVG